MVAWYWLIVALSAGACLGLIVAGMCCAASREDKEEEKRINENNKEFKKTTD